jgi:membrane-bound ClpP family serine protease
LSLLAIALLLFAAALVIFVIDLMIPTGGVLIAVTGIFAFAAILVAFRHSSTAGIWMLIATLGALPIMMFLFFVLWPKTPLGRRMISAPESTGTYVWSDAAKTGDGKSLVGAEGIALNEMIPSGMVKIGDQQFEAFSESGPIDAGKPVRVVRLDVGRLVVIQIRANKPTDWPMSHGTGLDSPISDLNLDSID